MSRILGMTSKTFTGWTLIAAPIMFFLVFFIGWSLVIGDAPTAADEVVGLLEKPFLSSIIVMMASILLPATFVSYSLLAWSRADGSTTVGTLSSIASIVFIAIAAIVMVASGSSFAVLAESSENTKEAEWIVAVTNGFYPAIFWFWGLGNIILCTALLIEKKINTIASGLLILSGALMAIVHFLFGFDELQEILFMVPFAAVQIATVVLGIFTLRSD